MGTTAPFSCADDADVCRTKQPVKLQDAGEVEPQEEAQSDASTLATTGTHCLMIEQDTFQNNFEDLLR